MPHTATVAAVKVRRRILARRVSVPAAPAAALFSLKGWYVTALRAEK
jgi:hypothetical protein